MIPGRDGMGAGGGQEILPPSSSSPPPPPPSGGAGRGGRRILSKICIILVDVYVKLDNIGFSKKCKNRSEGFARTGYFIPGCDGKGGLEV